MAETSELNKRMVMLFDKLGYRKSEYAEKLNVGPAVISHIYSFRNKPGVELIQSLLAAFPEINERWLLLGEGEMLKTDNQAITSMFKEKLNNLSNKMALNKSILSELADELSMLKKLL